VYKRQVKYRLKSNNGDKDAATYALHNVLYRILLLLAPFAPYITDEIYNKLYAPIIGLKSIHLVSWPTAKVEKIDKSAIINGDIIIKTIKSMRRSKAKARIPLNVPIRKVIVYGGRYKELLKSSMKDIMGTLKIQELIIADEGSGKEKVDDYPEIEFTLEV